MTEALTCSRCGGVEFVKDGVRTYEYGSRQMLRCKTCKKRMQRHEWLTYDAKVRAAYDKRRFDQYLKDKAEYCKAKKALGFGGFRVNDL